jgi:cytoskeletal protein CcmA (bactofilin family)
MAEGTQEYGTIIGADATFKGDLSFDSTAKVLGRVEGTIKSKGKVQVAKGAQCKAIIEAKQVEVEGEVEGDIHASEKLELKPNGIVRGDITATRMSMGEGASIDGHLRIGSAAEGKGGKSAASATELKPASAGGQPQQSQRQQPAAAGAR